MKKTILKVVAKLGYNMALEAAGAASIYGIYQPVEPKALQQLRNKK
jgi:cyclic lactone autoinducer peptide